MARPFDPRENAAAEAFADLPLEWQEDGWVQTLYQELMDPDNNWDEAKTWYALLREHIAETYNADFNDYFDWDTWRRNYNAYKRPHLRH